MRVTPFRHDGLGNSAYLLDVGDGKAALVDPSRSVEPYLAAAADLELEIQAVLETHLHADFVTGSLEVAERTGSDLYVAEAAGVGFPHRPVRPGDRFEIGSVEMEPIGSPGHTPEHLSYVARSQDGSTPSLFSGGSLIAGGAARTDLIDPSLTEELTRDQFRTLHVAFRDLPDDTVLFPTHGGGSFCSVGGSSGTDSTLGEERRSNPLLQFDDEDEFARWFPSTFPAAPSYFRRLRPVNRRGPRLRRDIPRPVALDPSEFDAARSDAFVVDTRSTADFASGHVPGSLSISISGSFAVWLGWLAPADIPLAFLADEGSLDRVVEESMLVGYEDFTGWLRGGIEAWRSSGFPVVTSGLADPVDAAAALAGGAVAVDVREPAEFEAGHVPGALHVPLGQLAARAEELPRDIPLLVYCGEGARASSGVSVLERAGLGPLTNLRGGMRAWRKAGYPQERAARD